MQLFYAPDIVPPEYTLSEEESKHCIRVLRMACGEELHITDGRGNLYRCEIVDDNPKRCRVRVRDTNSEFGKLPYRLTMAVAPTKNNDRFEWFWIIRGWKSVMRNRNKMTREVKYLHV